MEGNIGVTGGRGDERRWTEGNWVIGRSGEWAIGWMDDLCNRLWRLKSRSWDVRLSTRRYFSRLTACGRWEVRSWFSL